MRLDAWKLDACGQAEAVRRGEASAAELTELSIRRIERLNPRLNCVIHTDYVRSRRMATEVRAGTPFAGVPILIKDALCRTAGDPYHFGSQFLREAAMGSSTDTYLAASLREAGFILLGRTNTPELASAFHTDSTAYGVTRNPWNDDFSSGGSSGGSAAAVAARLVPIAHGNDMGGSIRVPASACGLVGMKPSRGRLSLGPSVGNFWGGLAQEGFLARSTRDIAGVLDATRGYRPGDPQTPPDDAPYVSRLGAGPRLRILVRTRRPISQTEASGDCREAVSKTADILSDLGHVVEYGDVTELDDAQVMDTIRILYCVGIARELDAWAGLANRKLLESDVEPRNWAAAEFGNTVSATRYEEALEYQSTYSRRILERWAGGFDLLLCPTIGSLPPRIGSYDAPADSLTHLGDFTRPFNVTGQPAMSLPVHWTSTGLPVGVQLVGRYGAEDMILRVAAELESEFRWGDRVPEMADVTC